MKTEIIAIVAIAVAVLIVLYGIRIAKKIINRWLTYKIDTMISSMKYSEDDIVGHLDYIIQEALDDYVITNITPKNIYYIKGSIENEIVSHLQEVIPGRISKTLLVQLSIVYNDDYIAEFIGHRIYFSVVNYVLNYNMSHGQQEAAPPSGPTQVNLDL